MEDTSERPAVTAGAPPAGADGDTDKLTYLYEDVVNDERWKTVAHIIGAEDLATETAGLELEGEAWAEERFGAEARCFVKVFDALTAMSIGADVSDTHSPDTEEDREAHALTSAWDRAFAHARHARRSRAEARDFADEYTAFVKEQWGAPRDPDAPIPSPGEYADGASNA